MDFIPKWKKVKYKVYFNFSLFQCCTWRGYDMFCFSVCVFLDLFGFTLLVSYFPYFPAKDVDNYRILRQKWHYLFFLTKLFNVILKIRQLSLCWELFGFLVFIFYLVILRTVPYGGLYLVSILDSPSFL